jgi:hypothetical protein
LTIPEPVDKSINCNIPPIDFVIPCEVELGPKKVQSDSWGDTAALDGKALVVCMSRRICVELYRELVKLRPGWQDEDEKATQTVLEQAALLSAEWATS